MSAEEIEAGAFFSLEIIQQWMASHPEEFTPLFKMAAKEFLSETKRLDALFKKESQ